MLYELIGELLPGGDNVKIYQELFAKMDDAAFDTFIQGLDEGTTRLALIVPNMSEHRLDVQRNFDLAEKLGHEFFEQVWMEGANGAPPYLSPVKYLVVDLPLRRQAQHLIKKISIPDDNRSVDNLTGQPTGSSKGSKISYPELQILAALKLDDTATELIKFRGGDQKGFNAMNNSIAQTGGVSQKSLMALNTKVKSTETLSTMLVCMHLSNTLSL